MGIVVLFLCLGMKCFGKANILAGLNCTLARISGLCLFTQRLKHHAVAPSRGRGSKPWSAPFAGAAAGRPLTGARIETGQGDELAGVARCRPLTGARIETSSSSMTPDSFAVAPSRGRGSKRP